MNPAAIDPVPYHIIMLEEVRRKADEFDTLHFHIDFLHAPLVHDFTPCLALVIVATRSGSSGGPAQTSPDLLDARFRNRRSFLVDDRLARRGN
jgi:hypothetical protein